MKKRAHTLLKHIFLMLGYGLLGAFIVGISVYVYVLESRPDLKVWHEAKLDAEFTSEQAASVTDLPAYLAVEDRVMQQLDEQVYDRISDEDRRSIVRYHRGSLMDPGSHAQNWNRTFELVPERPVAAAMLLHGLTDSPYSLRAVAQALHQRGVRTLGLRMPGHGTAPAALTRVHWKDFVAAVRVGMQHLRQQMGDDHPVYIVGYSNGAALGVEYALSVLEGAVLPRVDGLVLLSPAIGVSPVAALAVWQARLGRVGGFKKLAWNSIQLEFDPYKYNSFPVNAGDQIFRLTSEIERRINNLSAAHGLVLFPKTIVFQSVVDSTVPPNALLDKFLMKLEGDKHELILFDVNRHTETEPLLRADPEHLTASLMADPGLPFELTLVTNSGPTTDNVMARVKFARTPIVQDRPLSMAWPIEVFSLSHVAVPFSPEDPLYGATQTPRDGTITLGAVTIRGERHLLEIPDSYFLRLRHNPFFDYMIERIMQFLELE